MSLLRKASIVTTPTAYENGKILSVKPSIVLGQELVTNGDFATDSDWTLGSGWSIGDNELIATSMSNQFVTQSFTFTSGKRYRASFSVAGTSSLPNNTSLRLPYDGSTSNIAYVNQNSDGVYSHEFISNGNTNLYLGYGSFTGSISNVSVKEVLDADFDFTRNSSATRVNSQGLIEDMQILSGDLVSNGDFSQEGAELITNGDFATDSDWTKGTGITISGGSANFTGVANANINQNAGLVNGKTYKIVFTVSNYVSGNIDYNVGGNTRQGEISANGTYTDYVVSDSGQLFYFQSDQTLGFTASIENVSVKEVGQDWTLGNGWSIGANKAIGDGTMGGNDVVRQLINFSQGTTYRFSFTVLDYVSGGVFIRNPFNGYLDIASANGSYSFDYVAGINDYIDFRGNSFIGSISNISVIEITEDTNLPRIDYTGGEGHWLFEPQSTNLIPYSEDFSDASWQKSGSSITSNSVTSPNGTLNADKLVESSTIGTHWIREIITVVNGKITFSIFAKKGERDYILLRENTRGGYYFNLNDGTIGGVYSNAPDSYEIKEFSNGWYKCSITVTVINSTADLLVYTANSNNSNNYQGDGTSGIYIWGAQLEQNSFSTSIIPTSGSTVTRLQDAAFGAGSSDLINSTEGVLYFEGSVLDISTPNSWISVSEDANFNSNQFNLRFVAGINLIQVVSRAGGLGQDVVLQYTLSDKTTINKIAIKYKLNDWALWVNGIEVDTETSSVAFTSNSLDILDFDRGNNSNQFYGNVKCVAVFKEALTDAELTCLTTI